MSLNDSGQIASAHGRSSWLAAAVTPSRVSAEKSQIGAVSEAFVLAEKLGLDAQKLFDIASKSSGQCWSMTSYCPVPGVGPETPADRDYEGGFATALMLKDLRLAMEAAQSVDGYTPMGSHAEELYSRFSDLGGAGKDFSAIIRMIDDSWQAPAGSRSASPEVTTLED